MNKACARTSTLSSLARVPEHGCKGGHAREVGHTASAENPNPSRQVPPGEVWAGRGRRRRSGGDETPCCHQLLACSELLRLASSLCRLRGGGRTQVLHWAMA